MSGSDPLPDDSGPDRPRFGFDWRDGLVRLLIGLRWPLFISLVAVLGLAWWFGTLPQVTIPRWLKVFSAAYALGSLAVAFPAYVLVKWLWDPERVYLVDIDPETDDLAMWELDPQTFAELEVIEGEIHPLTAQHRAFSVREYDPEAVEAKGTPRGGATDLELLGRREEIREIRDTLEERARWGVSLRIQLASIVRSVTIDVLSEMVETYEEYATFRGEKIGDTVEEALSEHDLDEDLRDLDEDLEIDPESDPRPNADEHPAYGAQNPAKND